MGRIKEETYNGIKWTAIPWLALKPLTFIYTALLARLVSPHEFGILEITAIFFALAGNLNTCGMGTALIRKQDRTDEDCNTVFWYNVGMSAVLMLFFWCFAPLLAAWKGIPDLCLLTIVSSFMMFLHALAGVHNALLMAERRFKAISLIGAVASLLSMPLTLLLAYWGFSYWSLVLAEIAGGILYLILVWRATAWKPRFVFSLSTFKEFFSFGIRLTLAGMITNIYDGSRKLVISVPAQIALFDRSFKLCSMPLNILFGFWKSTALPIIATIQDDNERLVRVYRKYLSIACLMIEWGMVTIVANSKSVIVCYLGTQWLECAIYMQILCFSIMFNPITLFCENLFIAKGRSDIVLNREIIMRVVGITTMAIGAFYGVIGICLGAVASDMFCALFSMYLTRKVIPISMAAQFSTFLPYFGMAVIANIPAYFINELPLPPYVIAPLGITISAVLYYTILRCTKNSILQDVIDIVKEKLAGKFAKILGKAKAA